MDSNDNSRYVIKTAIIAVFALGAAFANPARAQQFEIEIDSVRIDSGGLYLDFHADSLLTDRLLENMKRGITSAVNFKIQLWRRRNFFLGALVAEREYDIKTTFDPWEKKYVVETLIERRLTSSLPFVRETWEQHGNTLLADSTKLSLKHRYYIVIEAMLEPVSRENLQEIRGWLSGEVKSLRSKDSTNSVPKDDGPGFRDRLFNVVVDLTGFGEKMISIKSEYFHIQKDGRVVFEE